MYMKGSRDPVTEPVKPVTTMDPLYGVPTCPTGRLILTIEIGVTVIVICRRLKFDALAESCALTTNVNVPDTAGVPLSTPPAESPRPAGRLPLMSDHVKPDAAQHAKSWLE